MNILKNLLFITVIIGLTVTNSSAQTPHFIDFQKILNESIAGKKAQNQLKNSLEQTVKKLEQTQKNLQDQEKKIIQQKKLISPEEYKKQVDDLRKKVSDLQKNRANALQKISKQRAKAKKELLKNLNPIIQNYMQEKKIRMVLNKKDLILADEKLDITKNIMDILNKKIKSINFN
tara:strand:+ start:818 stop:1342 length:525 start_codon:yes stop_codon:yes gene_type:complete